MENKDKLIWVVEDDAIVRQEVQKQLQKKGYNNVRPFENAYLAVTALNELKDKSEHPALIITDNDTMSKQTGLDVLKKAKELKIPSIMLSRSYDVQHQAEALGATFIRKRDFLILTDVM